MSFLPPKFGLPETMGRPGAHLPGRHQMAVFPLSLPEAPRVSWVSGPSLLLQVQCPSWVPWSVFGAWLGNSAFSRWKPHALM